MDKPIEVKEHDDDLDSNFSYVKSDNLNVHNPEKIFHPQPPTESMYSNESTYSNISPTRNTINETNESSNSGGAVSGSGSGSIATPISNKELGRYGPPIGKRESVISQVSDYSGKENHIAHPVSVKVINQDVKRSVSKKYYSNEENNSKERQGCVEDVLREDSVKLGKLDTKPGITSRKIEPDMSVNTTVESSVPPRSARRPKSEIVLTNNELDKDIEKFNSNKNKSHSRHSSLAISDDLDKLMASANSITKRFFVFNNVDGVLHQPGNEPIEGASQAQQDTPHPRNFKESIHSTNSLAPSRISSSHTLNSYQTAEVPSADVLTGDRKKRSLPPRPTADNLRRAREVSSQVSDKHKLEEPLTAIEEGDHNDSTIEETQVVPEKEVNADNEYYDIDEPFVVEQPSRGKSVKDSIRGGLKKLKRKSKTKRDRSQNPPSLKPFSYHTLINLLESTNGTIIGEEFDQLNLPIKEKQLIEKIVDSLSRLTLDMVLDENRYEVGITRLEKAHRVLEGFM